MGLVRGRVWRYYGLEFSFFYKISISQRLNYMCVHNYQLKCYILQVMWVFQNS